MAAALQPLPPEAVWQSWNWDPFLLSGLLFLALFYARAVVRLWQQAGVGRAVGYRQALAFIGGWLGLVIALVSPLDALGGALLSAHMVQHLLLTLVAAPLLVFGAPPVALAWGAPRSSQLARWWHRRGGMRRAARWLTRAVVAWAVHLLVLWIWHLPALYQAALLDETVHIVEHATFLGAALLFWWVVLPYRPKLRRPSTGSSLLLIFTTGLLGGLLGVLLTFSQTVWYPAYGILPYAWGLTPLQDQQLAGVIMWFPGGLVYLAVALLLLGSTLQRRVRNDSRSAVVVAPRQPLKAQS